MNSLYNKENGVGQAVSTIAIRSLAGPRHDNSLADVIEKGNLLDPKPPSHF